MCVEKAEVVSRTLLSGSTKTRIRTYVDKGNGCGIGKWKSLRSATVGDAVKRGVTPS